MRETFYLGDDKEKYELYKLARKLRLYKKIFIIFPEKSIINTMAKDTNTDIAIISNDDIKSKIYTIRGMQVMLDSNPVEIYGYETKNFDRQVKNNIEKFPADMIVSR